MRPAVEMPAEDIDVFGVAVVQKKTRIFAK